MLAGRRLPTRPLKELTEREVAVSCERAGPERVGQGQRLPEVAVGLLEIEGIAMGDDLPEQSKTPRLVIAFPMSSSQRQGLLDMGQRLVEALLEQIGFAEPPELHGPAHAHGAHRGRALYHVREETAGFRRLFREHTGVTETSEHGPGLQAPLDDEDTRTLQRRDRLVKISLSERHAAEPRQSFSKREWMLSGLSYLEGFLSMCSRGFEASQIRQRQSKPAVSP